jgi:tetratricopeptide (TPR) repeat protein
MQIMPDEFAEAMRELEIGNVDRAIDLFLKVIASKPGSTDAYRLIAICYLASKEWGSALAFFRKYDELSPGDPGILVNIGKLEGNLGDFEIALEYFQKAMNSLDSLKARGQTNLEQAQAELQHLIDWSRQMISQKQILEQQAKQQADDHKEKFKEFLDELDE